ncbi:MAG TPA: LamB/YcsF family protein [Thermoanaerobaculia bacterium]|nr:LamB/YcsF family protein [Thermoanaerobaculia bacterium]
MVWCDRRSRRINSFAQRFESLQRVIAREPNLPVVRGAFVDRRYMPDGSLVSGKHADALLSIDEAAEQAHRLATKHAVIARGGASLALEFDTLCLHAGTPGPPATARTKS